MATDDDIEAFKSEVTRMLGNVGLDDETFVDYCVSVASMDDPDEEKREGLSEFLGEATEDPVDDLIEEMLKLWTTTLTSRKQRQVDEEEKSTVIEDAMRENKRILEESANILKEKAAADAKELELKKKVLELAGDDEGSGEEENEDKDKVEYTPKPLSAKKEKKLRKQMDANSYADMFENTNKQRVLDGAKAQRESKKIQSQSKKSKDKQDLQADKERKEKQKEARRKAATKGERRR